MIGSQNSSTSLWQAFGEILGDLPGQSVFLREVLNVLADLIAKAVRNRITSDDQRTSLQTVTHLLCYITVPAASSNTFQGVFRQLCNNAQGMHSVLAFLTGSFSPDLDWNLEHAENRISTIYGEILDGESKLFYRSRLTPAENINLSPRSSRDVSGEHCRRPSGICSRIRFRPNCSEAELPSALPCLPESLLQTVLPPYASNTV